MMVLPLHGTFLLVIKLLLLHSVLLVRCLASEPPIFCDPEVLAVCPHDTFIPYEEFSVSFPVIEYCIRPNNEGFIPVTRDTCESFVRGTWTVRPEWAARRASHTLQEQYRCTVCQAYNASALVADKAGVWIFTLHNTGSYSTKTFKHWGSLLGDVSLNQLVVSGTGKRYLFALASYASAMKLLNASSNVLAAQPMPEELKISPRVVDRASVIASSVPSPSQSDGRGETSTLAIYSLISSHTDTILRASYHDDALRAIHEALGLPLSPETAARVPPLPQAAPPQEVGIVVTHSNAGVGGSSPGGGCNDCTVETTGHGSYLVSKVPVQVTAEVAANVSRALASAFVIDLAVPFSLFNKEAAYLLQSGTNSTSLGVDGKRGSTWLWDQGLTGEGEVVGLADTGLDVASCFFHDSEHPITFEPVYDPDTGAVVPTYQSAEHRKVREYFAYADGGEGVSSGHGTHVAGSAVGYPAEMAPTSKGFKFRGAAWAGAFCVLSVGTPAGWGGRICLTWLLFVTCFSHVIFSLPLPFPPVSFPSTAKLAFFDIGLPHDTFLYLPPDLATGLFPRTYNLGGRIHCNSWGSSISDNSAEMRQTDAYLWEHQDFLILYASGNGGSRAGTIGTPALSKNSVAVGATTNNVDRPDVAFFSSRGPTFDMRFGIDVCAPGYYVASAYSQADSPPNQCYIQGVAGTSMATPHVAGTAALLRGYFVRGFYPLGWPSAAHAFVPMGALLKAMLINSALPMTGPEATKHNTRFIQYPNYDQGYGLVAAKFVTYFQGSENPNVLFVDGAWEGDAEGKGCVSCPQLSQGQSARYEVVPTSTATLKVTLAWYDHPAAVTVSSRTLINDLDLTATQGDGSRYFANGWTSTAGPNSINNVEQLVIPDPLVGVPVSIQVVGASVAAGPQPYALVITGQFEKSPQLFPNAVPKVLSVATDGKQGLLVGRNLPRASEHPQSYTWSCVSDPAVQLGAQVLRYSPETAEFLAVVFNTTACSTFTVAITSDGFEGNASGPFNYTERAVTTFCTAVASDDTCWGLTACAGQCLQTEQVEGGRTTDVTDRTSVLVVVVVLSLLLACCGGLVWMRKHCRDEEEEDLWETTAPPAAASPRPRRSNRLGKRPPASVAPIASPGKPSKHGR